MLKNNKLRKIYIIFLINKFMSATPMQNPEHQRRLSLLVRDTLGRGRSLNIARVQFELGVTNETAGQLMQPYSTQTNYHLKSQSYSPKLV